MVSINCYCKHCAFMLGQVSSVSYVLHLTKTSTFADAVFGGGGGANSRCTYVSNNFYVKTKESRPLGGGACRLCPLGSAKVNGTRIESKPMANLRLVTHTPDYKLVCGNIEKQ